MKCKRAGSYDGKSYVGFQCPGCNQRHYVQIAGPNSWQWNGSFERPTITPSLNILPRESKDGTMVVRGCHCTVADGWIYFEGDSQHRLAGQRVELPTIA